MSVKRDKMSQNVLKFDLGFSVLLMATAKYAMFIRTRMHICGLITIIYCKFINITQWNDQSIM